MTCSPGQGTDVHGAGKEGRTEEGGGGVGRGCIRTRGVKEGGGKKDGGLKGEWENAGADADAISGRNGAEHSGNGRQRGTIKPR